MLHFYNSSFRSIQIVRSQHLPTQWSLRAADKTVLNTVHKKIKNCYWSSLFELVLFRWSCKVKILNKKLYEKANVYILDKKNINTN
jgi:hypothetical protein